MSSEFLNLQSLPAPPTVGTGAGRQVKLARFTHGDLFDQFLLPRRGKILLDLPALSGKRISFLDEQPFLSFTSSFHQGKGEAALQFVSPREKLSFPFFRADSGPPQEGTLQHPTGERAQLHNDLEE